MNKRGDVLKGWFECAVQVMQQIPSQIEFEYYVWTFFETIKSTAPWWRTTIVNGYVMNWFTSNLIYFNLWIFYETCNFRKRRKCLVEQENGVSFTPSVKCMHYYKLLLRKTIFHFHPTWAKSSTEISINSMEVFFQALRSI